MATIYTIDFTDPSKGTLSINEGSTDGTVSPTSLTLNTLSVTASTSLLLYGKNVPGYGERMQENLINVMEHFSGSVSPVFPTRGQIWHDTSTNMLRIYNGSAWDSLQSVYANATAPISPITGQLWFDTNLPIQLRIYDGISWIPVASNYLPLTGGALTGILSMGSNKITNVTDPTANQDAATKKYVDDTVAGSGLGYTPVDQAGDNMTGPLTINGNTVWHAGNDGTGSTLDADLLDGQDSTYYTNIVARLGYTPVNIAGDTMTGTLIMSGATINMGNNKITNLAPATFGTDALSLADANSIYVALAGGTMSGYLILNGDPLVNLGAATKQYVDAKVSKAGDSMSGTLDMSTNSITNLPLPTAPADAASKLYVDKKIDAVSGFTLSQPANNAVLMRIIIPSDATFPSGFTGSYAISTVAPTAITVYTLKRNGATIGTVTYAIASNTGVYADNTEIGAHSFSPGDIITLHAPAAADATHDGLAWTIVFTFD